MKDFLINIVAFFIVSGFFLIIIAWLIVLSLDVYYQITGQKEKLNKLWHVNN